nr:UPF0503 protein At3g09070, chloroplastic-like [Ipomoea batatas]
MHIVPAALIENHAENGGRGVRRSNAVGDSSSTSSFALDLRRCRSVSASRLEATDGSIEPHRKSCDVRDRNTLALLIDINDKNNAPNANTKVESKNIRFSRLAHCDEELVEDAEIGEEIRVPVNTLQPNVEAANDDVSMEGELKTMKEYIDLEIQSKSQKPNDLKDIAVNFWEAASVFSKKLRKWRQKQTAKKPGSQASVPRRDLDGRGHVQCRGHVLGLPTSALGRGRGRRGHDLPTSMTSMAEVMSRTSVAEVMTSRPRRWAEAGVTTSTSAEVTSSASRPRRWAEAEVAEVMTSRPRRWAEAGVVTSARLRSRPGPRWPRSSRPRPAPKSRPRPLDLGAGSRPGS